ncbi:MAG: PepSY domain-containing protein, partial [Steroidobacteraceae bacterium]
SKEQHSEQRDQNLGTHSQGLSPAKAVALVQRRYHAQVVRTKMQTDASGRQLYVFRLLSAAGRVWTVRIDAHTGAEVP